VFAELASGQVWEARTQMQRITMRVILSAVFGLHEGERYRRLEALLQRNLALRSGRFGTLMLFLPRLRRDLGGWSPGGRVRRLEAETRALLRQHRLALTPACDRPLPPRRRGFILGPSRPVRLRVLQV
jgi:hypothetical protein